MSKSSRKCQIFQKVAFLLFLLFAFGTGMGTFVSMKLLSLGYYHATEEEIGHDLIAAMCADDIYELRMQFEVLRDEGYFEEDIAPEVREELYKGFMEDWGEERTNFFFNIHTADNEELFSSYKAEDQFSEVQVFTVDEEEEHSLTLTEEESRTFELPQGAYNCEWYEDSVIAEDGSEQVIYQIQYRTRKTEEVYYICGHVRDFPLQAQDKYSQGLRTVHYRYLFRYAVPAGTAVCAVLAFALLMGLTARAGKGDDQERREGFIPAKVPYEVFLAGVVAAALMIYVVIAVLSGNINGYEVVDALIVGTGTALAAWLLLVFCAGTACYLRTRTLGKNSLCVRLGKWMWSKIRRAAGYCRDFIASLPFLWKALACAAGFLVCHLAGIFLMNTGYDGTGLLLLLLLDGILFIFFCGTIRNLHILFRSVEKMADGDFQEKIPEEKLTGVFRKQARHLNSLSDGMNKAISERLKSERFRTELIANVSHDLRTPLTSIISYSDLLSQLDLQDEKAKEYTEVIARQADRLKKLTDDVLEASKAATGNVRVESETMDLRVLISQAEGEFAERLEARNLQLVCSVPESPVTIFADGALTWRVLDNLLGNICKYAMEGTRVYLNAMVFEGECVLVLRNISAVQLNIDAQELMERFVQGDRSRSTEGSGLGLSIAQSLMTVQGGRMELQIDGDLFKVTLYFPPAA